MSPALPLWFADLASRHALTVMVILVVILVILEGIGDRRA